jgi:hypothetical protein
MRHLRQLCCTLIVHCLLVTAVWADDGILHPEGPTPPPPQPPPATTGTQQPEDPLVVVLGNITLDLYQALTGGF